MISNHAVIVLGGIISLNQMVPDVPLPDDIGLFGSDGLNLYDLVGPKGVLAHLVGVASCLLGFCFALEIPRNHQKIPIGQWFDIVMAAIGLSGVEPFPFHFTVPGQTLNLTSNPVAIMIKIGTKVDRSQQISILEHVGRHTGGQPTRRCPRVNHSPMCVNEVCALG